MGTTISHPERNRNIATAAALAFKRAENPPPRTSDSNIRIEDFLTTVETEVRKSKKKAVAAVTVAESEKDQKQDTKTRDNSRPEVVSWGNEHVFYYNDTGPAWTKLEQLAAKRNCEPYIGRDGKTPCTKKIQKASIVLKRESDKKLVDAWLRSKTPRPSTVELKGSEEDFPGLTDADFGDVDDTADENSEICYHCKESFLKLVTCRVCGRSIHTPKCVYQETSGDIIVTATSLRCFMTDFVWSCPDCENLLGLLHDEEMIELMECFDNFDMDCDSRISLDDFLKFKHKSFKAEFKRPMDDHEIETAVEEFQMLDKPKNGFVDWWSFVDSQIVEKLSHRSKNELVKCLTPHEVKEAGMFFRSFDADHDGKITLREAEKAYERWFASLWSKVLNCSDSLTGPKKNPELSKVVGEHVKVNVRIFMEADNLRHGTVSWNQFLRDQAIYILAARRNSANLYKIRPREEELEIIRNEIEGAAGNIAL